MRGPSEKIELDAQVVSMIRPNVLAVQLKNGHCFVALAKTGAKPLRVNDTVRVRLCPGDLSRGYIVAGDSHHEG